jgi:arylsulfatase A-like enzyme
MPQESSTTSLNSVRRQVVAIAAATLWLCLGLAFGRTVWIAIRNGYAEYGFWQSVILILQGEIAAYWRLVLCGVLFLWIVTRLRQQTRRDGLATLIRLLALGGGLGFFLALGEHCNRKFYADEWTRLQDWGGLELPRALGKGEVWLLNVGLAVAALLVVAALWLLLSGTLGRRPSAAGRVWTGLQRPLPIVVAVVLVVASYAAAKTAQARALPLPNFIVISLDTLRADHLGCYGYERPTSIRLDELARESVLFEWAFSPAPNTPPAHMSLFTSLYPTVHGFTGDKDKLPDRRLTLSEYLREYGYRTFATTDGGYLSGRVGFGQGFERFDDRRKGIAASAALALRWLDREIRGNRFFLFLHCYDIHSPYDPPAPYRDLFADPAYRGAFQPTAERLSQIKRRLHRHPAEGHGLDAAEIAYMRDRYDEGIRYADEQVGLFIEELRRRRRLETTWLIVLSDHGEELTEHGSVLHDKLYHTVTRIPLLVRPPGSDGLARRIPQIVELTDVMPTLLEIAGIPSKDLIQGRSLLRLLEGRHGPWKDTAFSELPWSGRRRAITTPSSQLITSLDGGEVEIYRYREDAAEQRPLTLADTAPEGQQLLDRLLVWSAEQLAIAADRAAPAVPVPLDRRTAEQLRSLGYIQ